MPTLKMHRKYGIVTNFLDTMLEHEVVIQEGETKLDAYRRGLKELDQIAADLRKEANPHLYQEEKKDWKPGSDLHPHMKTQITFEQPLHTISQQTEPETDNLTAIQNAATLEELKSFKLLAAGDKILYTAYCQRIKELAQ